MLMIKMMFSVCTSFRLLSRPLFCVFLVTTLSRRIYEIFVSRNKEAITLRQFSTAGV